MTITINGTTGITTPEVILDNTAADGGQVVLKSSGYSNWNLDNYSGRFRGYYGSTEYFTVDASGNMGIGTSSPARKIDVNGDIQSTNSSSNYSNLFFGVYGTPADSYTYIRGDARSTGFMAYYTNATERARIDSSGYWLVNKTSATTYGGIYSQSYTVNSSGQKWVGVFDSTVVSGSCQGLNIVYSAAVPNGTANEFLYCGDQTNLRFAARSNGGIANYSANNANLSDERTKTDIQDAGSYLSKICAIPVRTFKYKDQTDDLLNLGVIAQEVEAVAPELVDVSGFGETPEDGIPLKAIYQTDLQYALMKCIQEQQAIINQLQSDVAALKGQQA